MSDVLNYLVAARRCEANELENLSRTCDLVLAVNALVHCLQQERGITNIFLASSGRRDGAVREAHLAASELSYHNLLNWLATAETDHEFHGGARLYTRLAFALHTLEQVGLMRARIAQLSCTPAESSECYKQAVSALLALVFEAADVAVEPGISRLLIALFHLMQGKAFAGRDRALGAASFAAGKMTTQQIRSIEYLIEMQEQAFARFVSFAGDLRAEWAALQSGLPLPELERLRRKLLSAHQRSLDQELADAWYLCCSARMDELHRVATYLAELLRQQCREQVAELRRALGDQEQLFAQLRSHDPLSPLMAFHAQVPSDEVLADADSAAVGHHLSQTVVDMLNSQSERLQKLTEELASVRVNLDERKLIERAKGILMQRQGLDEESAYRLLRKKAMNQNRRIADVAQAVLSLADILPTDNVPR